MNRPAGEDDRSQAVLDFWFGPDSDDDDSIAQRQAGLWWGARPEDDARIRERFADLRERAVKRALDGWSAMPQGRLALILLIDQFSRSLFRRDARAFEHDGYALRLAVGGVATGDDKRLRPIHRLFLYLPFEHAESLAEQERSVQLTIALAESVPQALREPFDGFVDFARRHRDIIARFGRFPHRNAVVGRPSSAEEEAFLRQPGSSF